MPLSPAEQLLYCTVRLSASRGGRFISTGTGFYFSFPLGPNEETPCLVTNKHVISNADEISALCHLENRASLGHPSDAVTTISIDLRATPVFLHPNQSVDLCALPIAPFLTQEAQAGRSLFYKTCDYSIIPSDTDWDHFDAIEEVTMIGCPSGLYDEVNGLPLVRRGITASPLSKRFKGNDEFVVDMACFPGSSGSPVFLFDKMGYFDKKNGSLNLGGTRLVLVGILYSGPMITNQGTITLGIAPSVQVASMMHLGNVIRSSQLKEIGILLALQHNKNTSIANQQNIPS